MINGKMQVLKANQELNFEVSGSFFPYGASSLTRLEVDSTILGNEVTINYGDGSIITYPFTGTKFLIAPTNLNRTDDAYNYTDSYSGVRTISVKFKYPESIDKIVTSSFFLYGTFPSTIVNLTNLFYLIVGQSQLTSFPENLSSLQELRILILQQIGTAINQRIPLPFLDLRLTYLNINRSVNLFDIYASNFYALCSSVLGSTLTELRTEDCNISTIPTNTGSMVELRRWSMGEVEVDTIPIEINDLHVLYDLSISGANLKYYSSFSNLVQLNTFSTGSDMEPIVPVGLENCVAIKNIRISGFKLAVNKDTYIDNMYNFITSEASIASGNTKFRQMTMSIVNTEIITTPSGTYQQPAGFVLGVSNGTPASPLEKIWVMVNQYQHTWSY